MNSRIDKLRAKLDELHLDGLIVSQNADQQYLAGFSGHADYDSILLISRHDKRVVTDFRYWEAAEKSAPDFTLVKRVRGEYDHADAIRDFAKDNNLQVIGLEAQHVNLAQFKAWQKALRPLRVKLKPVEDLVKALRATKDEAEIAKIRAAVKVADDAFTRLLSEIRVGMTEKQGAWIIESYMRSNGAERMAFDPIVASGPNAALPHAEPTEREFQLGEPITIDIGAQVDGYNSDMTRTITLGHATDKFKEIYKVVLKAQLAVEKKARVGMNGKQVDRLARRVIDKAGYEKEFGHGLGHGVGRVVHEFPRAGKLYRKDVIEPGMILTVEPGIYIPGWGGVRIEDLVVFQSDGMEVLTQSSKEPVISV